MENERHRGLLEPRRSHRGLISQLGLRGYNHFHGGVVNRSGRLYELDQLNQTSSIGRNPLGRHRSASWISCNLK